MAGRAPDWIAALFACLVALCALVLPAAAQAQAGEVQLRAGLSVSAPQPAGGLPETGPDWTWLTLDDPAALRAMPGEWNLLVDQVRFRRIAVAVTGADGATERISRRADQLEAHVAPGGLLKFEIGVPGPEVRALAIGFERLDDLSLMRKVTAATPGRTMIMERRWLIAMGVFAGLLASAFVYNLFVYAGQGYAFQRWYLAWVAVSLAYGLTWSNMAGLLFPIWAGPLAVRVDSVLVGMTVAFACLFLLGVLEKGMVPRPLRRAVQVGCLASVAAGVLAADERLVPARPSDLALNLSMLLCAGMLLATIAIAAVRGSRVVWLYLVGWTPVIAVYAMRTARNFGLVGHSDLVDLATFGAIGFETLVFSLLIADRFVSLKKERDAAEAHAREMEVEKDTLERAALTDFLTGLGNRAFFHERMRTLQARGERFTLFLIDIDHLKDLNDRQGHDAGDGLLKHVGERLAALAGQEIFCARIGGDEFAILALGDASSHAAVTEALDAIQGNVWARHTWSGVLSLSVGSASWAEAATLGDLFQHADLALYEAKRQGRGRRQEFDGPLRLQIQTRLDMLKAARQSLRDGAFALHFQPIVDLRSGECISVEALLRWQHPELGLLTPEAFECVLDDEEVCAAVQERVMALAIGELRRRRFAGTLAVNFTAAELDGPEAARRLLQRLAAAEVAPQALCVEVTEGIILGRGRSDAAGALRVLHEAGVRIALDDFGTGYASLVHLKEIPVDTLKIDRSFVAGLLTDGGESEEIVRAVLALGAGLKKSVIAEGIETPAQLARLREMGCEQAQGYLFGRPSAQFEDSIAARDAA